MIKKWLIALLMLSVCSGAWAEELDKIVAVVNNEVVLNSELQAMEQQVLQQLHKRNAAIPPEKVLRKQVLERLIMKKLQLQKADSLGIRVGDDALNAALHQIAQNNNMTLRQFRDVLEKDGYDFSDFRENIRQQMIINRLRKTQVEDRVTVSNREVDNFLATQKLQGNKEASYHLRHILISVPDAATPKQVQAAEAKLKKVEDLLAKGGKFTEVAAGYSDGQNALDGGDLGWRKQGELPTIFAKVVPEMKVGEVSKPIRSGSGFHLVQLVDKKSTEPHMVKQTLVSHILIKTNQLVSDEQAKEKLEKIRQRILNGEDFAKLARAHSDDTGSAINGGSLGWVSPGQMVPKFEQVMNSLKKGQVSKVFKTRFGWHIMKVFDRREQNMAKEYERTKAREQIRKRKVEEEMENWLRTMRDEAYVEYRDN